MLLNHMATVTEEFRAGMEIKSFGEASTYVALEGKPDGNVNLRPFAYKEPLPEIPLAREEAESFAAELLRLAKVSYRTSPE